MISPCKDIAERMGELFSCATVGGNIRVRTPFLYPDGDVIDLYVREEGDVTTVTDLGETLRWLSLHTVAEKRTEKQKRLIAETCVTHGVGQYKGMILARATDPSTLAEVVTRVAQACLRVSDLSFTFRAGATASITDDVADFLRERRIDFQRPEPFVGRTQKTYRVDFHTRTPEISSLVQVLATGSRAVVPQITNRAFVVWHDLNYMRVGPEALRFVTLIDDTQDVWKPEELTLLAEYSVVAFWSRPDNFERAITSREPLEA